MEVKGAAWEDARDLFSTTMKNEIAKFRVCSSVSTRIILCHSLSPVLKLVSNVFLKSGI